MRYSIAPTTSDPPPRDPLKWFTALPPPALRQTQQHFIAALAPVTALLDASAQMATLEERVREARKELEAAAAAAADGAGGEEVEGRMESRTEKENRQGDEEEEEEEGRERDGVDASAGEDRGEAQSSLKGPLKGQLASRSRGTEPRSRVLKMQ